MNPVCWWLVNKASGLLDPDERNAVLGDFSESGTTGAQALRDVVDLVVRRQLALWRDWNPWLALMGVVVPLSILLSLACRWLAEGSATTLYLYVDNWTWGYLASPGARHDLVRYLGGALLSYATLLCWSYTSGFAIGFLSRRATWVNGALLGLAVYGELLLVSQRHNPFNQSVWSLTFYRAVFPCLLRTLLIFLPALWGMRGGFRRAPIRPMPSMGGAIAIAFLTAVAARDLAVSDLAGWLPLRATWELRFVPICVVWPAGLMVATARWRRWVGPVMACVLIAAIVTLVPALERSYTGGVVGEITGPDGSGIAGAIVTARNRRTGAKSRQTSDARGAYGFVLPMGSYEIAVERQGFETAVRKNVVVLIGGTGEFDFSLPNRKGG
jgi:Carboxypeptidase regulatory-like domain